MLQSSNFVISKVINPVLEKYTLVQNSETDVDEVQELKKLSDIAKSSKVVIQNFKYTGDLYKYIRSASKNNEAFSLFNKYNLTSFEDIFSEFEDNFKNEMNEVSSVSKLVVGNIYSTWDFVYLSDKYSARVPGILPVTSSSGKVTSVIARGNFSQDQKYQNKYISNEDIHYYLIGNINHKYNKFITVEKLPVHFFETVASNQQRYLGKYIYTKSYSDNSVLLVKESITSDKVNFYDGIVPTIPTRNPFKMKVNKLSSGSQIASERKINFGAYAEKCVSQLLKDKDIDHTIVANEDSYNYDININSLDIIKGLEVKNISNGHFYMSNTQVFEFKQNNTRVCFVDSTNINEVKVFISKKYSNTVNFSKILSEMDCAKDEVNIKHKGLFSVEDIKIALLDSEIYNINDDFMYINDKTREQILDFIL